MNYLLNGKKKWPGTILPTALCKVLSDMGTKILTGTCVWFSKINKSVLSTSLFRRWKINYYRESQKLETAWCSVLHRHRLSG